MKIELKTNEFLTTFNKWMERTPNFVPLAIIPSFFLVCSNEEKDLFALMVFEPMNSNTAWIGFPLKNPDSTKEEREGGLTYLLEESTHYLKNKGYNFIWTTSATPPVVEALKEANFKEGDTNINQYYYRWEK